MDERLTFIVAAIASELSALVVFYLFFSSSPLSAASPSLIAYAGQHGSLAIAAWVVVLIAAWFAIGPRLSRLRQNHSSKLAALACFGLVGIVIHNAVSLYQLSTADGRVNTGITSSSVVLGLIIQTAIYAFTFAGFVLVAYLISRSRKPTMTPPPRFGRD